MIYLDNAATSFPKPISVTREVNTALTKYAANPGRSGHKLAMKAGQMIYDCRVAVAKLFNVKNEENIIFTLNCTHSINTVLKGYLKEGDHVVISCLEHNSIVRPLKAMEDRGISFTEVKVYENDNDKTLDSFRKAINRNTRLIACTHASNVWGIKLPIERIAALAHEYGIKTMVDAAQSAGVVDIDFENSQIDFLCMPGHKGLYGPMGTGILIIREPDDLKPLMQGGTGSSSISTEHPSFVPDKFESGTANLPGISGLLRGVEFVIRKTPQRIFVHELKLMQMLHRRLSKNHKVKLYTSYPAEKYCVPLISFNVDGKDSEAVARYLNDNYSIAVRAGLHCSPLAHQYMNTQDSGAVRVSPSVFTTENDIYTLVNAINKIS